MLENINERIAWIITEKYSGNRSKFAREVGITPAYAAQIYSGERIPSDRTVADISRECGVDRVWLETGAGEPFRPRSREDEIATALAQAMNCNESAKNRIIRAMAQLPDELFPYVERILDELAANIQQDK